MTATIRSDAQSERARDEIKVSHGNSPIFDLNRSTTRARELSAEIEEAVASPTWPKLLVAELPVTGMSA